MHRFQTIRENYDCLSRWYDLVEGWGERSILQKAQDVLDLQPPEKLLEIGCGTGENLISLAKRKEQESLFGLDLSSGMLDQAIRKINARSQKCIHLVIGNSVWLPFINDCFDAVFFSFTLEIIPEDFLPKALEEVRRVLNSTGRVCVVSMSAERMKSMMMHLYLCSIKKFPRTVDCRPIPLEIILVEAGFRLVTNQAFSLWGLPVRLILAKNN